MGKITGFMDYKRKDCKREDSLSRLKHWNEFDTPLKEEERKEQAARCMDCGVPFCSSGIQLNGMYTGCPLHNLIPEWNHLIYLGRYELAAKRLLKTSNFPEFTSRVCPGLCEQGCTCGLNGRAVSVKANEKFIIEKAFAEGLIKANPPKIRTGKKVAVVGSGPAGLAAADILNKLGHNVVVYETRTANQTLSLTQRANIANQTNAKYLVSIHHNAGGGDRGEVIHSITNSGKPLATHIANELKNIGQSTNKVYSRKSETTNKDYYAMIKNPKAISVIVEVCFIDNAIDRQIADTKEERERNGVAIAHGILKELGISIKATSATTNNETLWAVCVGAYKDKNTANNLVEELKKKGYTSTYLIPR